jgi:hypothetical protein
MVKTIRSTKDNVISVVGTGNAGLDDQRFASAVAAANLYFTNTGRSATILIDRNVHILSDHVFTSPTGLECTKGSWLVREFAGPVVPQGTTWKGAWSSATSYVANDIVSYNSVSWRALQANVAQPPSSGSNWTLAAGRISYGGIQGSLQYQSLASGTISDIASSGGAVITTSAAYPLAAGDWVLVYGFNQLTDVTPHSPGLPQYPLEIHQINRSVVGSAYTYIFNNFLDDPFITSGGQAPRVAKLDVIHGIRIRNFNYRMKAGSLSASGEALYFQGCVDIEMSNCSFGSPVPGTVRFFCCSQIRRQGCFWGNLENFELDADNGDISVYGINDSVVTSADVQSCRFGALRHAYTTGGASFPGGGRAGSTKDVLIQGCTFGNNGRQTSGGTWSGMVMINPHAEGRRITICDNQFNVPGEASIQNRAIAVRWRDAIIRNNTFNCGPAATPVAIYATRATVANNTFNGGLRCEVIDRGTNANVDKVRFTNNTFRRFYSPAIYVSTGTDHEITGNSFEDCAYSATTGYSQAVIQVAGLSSGGTIKIKDNSLNKYTNLYSIDTGPLTTSQVTLEGNLCQGYGNLSMGLNRTLGTTGSIEMLNLSRNNTAVRVVVVNQTAHGISSGSIGRPITTSHTVYEDTVLGTEIAGVLGDVIGANHYILYAPGELFEISSSMIDNSYVFPTSGRDLFWDASVAKYKPVKPGDSAPDASFILRIHSYSATTAVVSVPVASQGSLMFRQDAIQLRVGDEGSSLATGSRLYTMRMPYNMKLAEVRASLGSAPVGSSVLVDINKSGSSILSTKLAVSAGQLSSVTSAPAPVLSDQMLPSDTEISIDIDQVGSTTPGSGLKVWLIGSRY